MCSRSLHCESKLHINLLWLKLGLEFFFLAEYLSVEILRMSLEQALRYGAGDLGGDLHRGFYDQRTQALMVKSSE